LLLATWELGDQTPELDSGWLFDHFSAVRDRAPTGDGTHEAFTTAAALAARTRRIQFGHIVLGNTHRHPALVARMATTIDHIAGPNRFVVGLGTGWLESDHEMFGWPLPSLQERTRALESAVRVIKEMWRNPEGATLSAKPYRLVNARTAPAPVTPGGPPVWLGVQGPRGLEIVARHADGWSANGTIEEYVSRRDQLLRTCDAVGRDPSEIEISAQVMCIGRSSAEVLEFANQLVAEGVDHLIFVILASDGPDGLQKLIRDVVIPLRQMHRS
jgi:alkanesulfonate monooxygenase SsuD/methylene tetrahydromethanopterin reductase-like flavin-dependent oxidoreductase (luciferase family)